MPHVTATDGTKLFYESTGAGPAIVFVHELAGSYRAFDDQVAALKDRYRCVAFNARGYPPSDVPVDGNAYSQDIAASDIGAVVDGLRLANAHLCGVSMGSASALQYALKNPTRMRSLTLVGIGTGSDQTAAEFQDAIETMAAQVEKQGLKKFSDNFAETPNRKTLKLRNPKAFEVFLTQYAAGSAQGMVNTMRGVQKRRPPIYVHKDRAAALNVPTLVVVGEKDVPCRKPSDFLKATIPGARLEVVAGAGHAVNIEEPEIFNRLLSAFLDSVEARKG